jgi:ferric-dicitrate binding protein FerR (iron transport regulator)
MHNTIKNTIEEYFSGELKSPERLALLKTLESNPELKQQFIELKNLYGLLALSDQPDNSEKGEIAYTRFSKNIKKRKILHFFTQIAASAAFLALLITATYWITVHKIKESIPAEQYVSLHVPAGQYLSISLQDGTKVWLNAHTTLTYPTAFTGKERRVRVEGEAFFEITKDEKKPFIVSSQGVEMKALGTQFNVYSYPDVHYMQTSLTEGSLKVYFPGEESKAILLKPNEQVRIQGRQMLVENIPYLDYFWWKKGIYSFHEESLANVLKKLERYYDIKINITDPSIKEWTYTGKFRHRDGIDEIIHLICKTHRFKVEKDEINNTITLK